jgi:hypothetical protein
VAERVVAGCGFGRHPFRHLGAVVAMEGVTLDEGGVDPLPAEDLAERPGHG